MPDPSNIDPEKGFDFIEGVPPGVWTIVAGVFVVWVASKIFNALPWKLLGPVAIGVIILIVVAK